MTAETDSYLNQFLDDAHEAKIALEKADLAKSVARLAENSAIESREDLERAIDREIEARVEVQRKVFADENDRLLKQNDAYRVRELCEKNGFSFKDWAPIFECLAKGEKIGAIKAVRELTGCGLKEAKYLVEGNWTTKEFPYTL